MFKRYVVDHKHPERITSEKEVTLIEEAKVKGWLWYYNHENSVMMLVIGRIYT